ncbi:DUF4173 domain-containing protein [Patescibacteria group bacterium]|nr:DUF4173 domain-containing protein [Patescibacteria group bacterium]MBU1721617.1 DUF4173 domain-containing protein [Patescibacteria group bacterium]MBU1901721.1 DUF4173 domain-containing protein [Patescibacteria group bacterium]
MFTRLAVNKSYRLAYIALAAILGILYDVFFWEQTLGIGFLLFMVAYVFSFVLLAKTSKHISYPYAFLLVVPILLMAVTPALYNNRLVVEAIPVVVPILAIIFSIVLTLQNPDKHQFFLRNIPILQDIDHVFKKWGAVIRDLLLWGKGASKERLKKVLIGVAIAMPILFVFGMLFVAADPVFADIIKQWLYIDDLAEFIWRIFRSSVMALFLAGFFYVLISKEHTLMNKERIVKKLDGTIVGVILTLVNVLFLFFVAVQFKYLFGSAEYVTGNSMVFAEYARNGFFQLVWVIVLAALMLVLFYRSSSAHGHKNLLTMLKVFLIVQVEVIAYSALHRMNLYQDAYGYTVLRLYVEWFIYLVLALLIFAAASMMTKLKFRTFFYTVLVSGIVAFTCVSLMNVDRMIAKENIDRALFEGKELDVQYLLYDLSIDTAPELKRAFDAGYKGQELYRSNKWGGYDGESIIINKQNVYDEYQREYKKDRYQYQEEFTDSFSSWNKGRKELFK